MSLALGGALDLVGQGLRVAAQPGDGDGVQSAVKVAVAAAVEAVSRALPAADLQRCNSGKGREGCLAADAAAVRPADEQLRRDDGTDTGFAEQSRPSRVGAQQLAQLGVQLAHLVTEKLDPGRDRLE